MSIRNGLLALLTHGPRYGYQLRAQFEEATGSTWPLNIGQVYSTLARLERDRLVESAGGDARGRTIYALTEAGRAEVARWFGTAVVNRDRPRDELAIKLALAVTTPGVDVAAVVQTQRIATLRTLQELTRLKARHDDGPADRAWALVRESMIFQAEAEIRWLDHCEAYVLSGAGDRRPADRARGDRAVGDRDAADHARTERGSRR